MWPLVEQIVQAELQARVMAPALEVDRAIRPTQLGADGPLLGAAELALTRVLDEPTLGARRVPPSGDRRERRRSAYLTERSAG